MSHGRTAVAGLLMASVAQAVVAQTFSRRLAESGLGEVEIAQGVALGDQDGDGAVDLFLTSVFVDNPIPFLPDLGSPDRLYLNDGAGRFSDQAPALGLDDAGQGLGPAWADWNNDGLLDLYVVRGFQELIGQRHLLYRQDAAGFDASPSAQVSAANAGRGACWSDYDQDGFVDVFITNGLDSSDLLPDARSFLFRNNGDGTFTDVTVAVGLDDRRNGHGCAWGDHDNDGDADLYVANHGFEDPVLGYTDPQANALFQNQLAETGSATFVDVAVSAGVDGLGSIVPGEEGAGANFGCAWGDVNNDGWLDLFVTSGFSGLVPFPTPNRLFVNDGDGTFTDRSLTIVDLDPAESSFGVTLGDFDNDGDLDAFVANADVPLVASATSELLVNTGPPLYLLTNEEASTRTDVQEWSQACASADLDGDGYLDIYVINGIPGVDLLLETPDTLLLNDGGANHWLHLDLVGTESNRSAIGARVTLRSSGRMQAREVTAGSGYQSMDDLRVEFGLGGATVVETITIRWPSGCVQVLEDIAADQVVEVVEECSDSILRAEYARPVAALFPLPEYDRAPPGSPWRDPEAVVGDGRTLLYRHSDDAVLLTVARVGGTVELRW